jgi:GNAT superfamily N-acetyltransferase
LGRLAIDLQFQGQRLGAALLKDAILRTLLVSRSIGVRAMLVHAISDDAKRFYTSYGFRESLINEMTLMLSLKQIKTHF